MSYHIELLEHPGEREWNEVKRRALVTVGLEPINKPTAEWKHSILEARHSPIRYLRFSFMLTNIPYWVSVHLVRHTHAQPYVRSQRNDRQNEYDRTKAPQDSPVNMIWDMNAEELMVIANKRLCLQASAETRAIVMHMCALVEAANTEFKGLLVPMCKYHGGKCHEMKPCGEQNAPQQKAICKTTGLECIWCQMYACERRCWKQPEERITNALSV